MDLAHRGASQSSGLLRKAYARELFRIGAITFSESEVLTWSSGLRVPFYCDNRLTNSFPCLRRQITDSFVQFLTTNGIMPETIVGTATAGISQAALVADRLALPMVYVRPERKQHGRGKQIEGRLTRGHDVVVVEDLIATGGSSLRVVEAIREQAESNVLALVAMFTYGFPGVAERFADAGVPLFTISDFDMLVSVAEEDAFMSRDRIATIRDWYRDPNAWSRAQAN